MKRRILSLLTALALCLSLLPATALAADGESVTYLTWSEEQGKLVKAPVTTILRSLRHHISFP